ncbi:hypothetical protein [Rhizobium rhizogenes]|uniref:hypothetical protein n=1 Tax=Rhizobium rhizogenes TaxID=359 RepID=UPI0015727022|nr:hypothetical protein [Rhizobium rhizogenes]NTG09251.1 hypothetical protein [Rhizobium rhizogenes]
MKLIEFTANAQDKHAVFVNPDHVVAVYALSKATAIVTVAFKSDNPYQISVVEPLSEVVARLTQ